MRDDFPQNVKTFFINLQNYLDTELYFFGSVNRLDYIHNKSDIDIAIFTDNEYSTMAQLKHFLHVSQKAFDKVVWKLKGNMIYGYKIKCDKHAEVKIKNCEIAIYNNEFKESLLNYWYKQIPFYATILLYILKTLYYTFPVLSKRSFSEYKRIIFDLFVYHKTESLFYLIKQT